MMVINPARNDHQVELGHLCPGDVFLLGETAYMVIVTPGGERGEVSLAEGTVRAAVRQNIKVTHLPGATLNLFP